MSSKLVDYFVVCALKDNSLEVDSSAGYVGNQPPLHRPFTAQVVCRFPGNRPWNPFDEGAIRTQCMPDGIKLAKNLTSFDSTFHSLIITRENGSRQYGSVLTFYEKVQNPVILDALKSLQDGYRPYHRTDLSPSRQYWYYNRNTDTIFATKCICLVTTSPIFVPCQLYLEQLYSITVGNERSSLPIESYLYNLLYEVPMPLPGQSIQLHGPLETIMWRCPDSNELPLCDYSFKRLFESLALKNVLRLLTCVLLEQQILLKGSDYQQLMLCAECITSLLFPFSWPHVFVPILPLSQHGFLDAPVPFIMGLRMDSNADMSELDVLNKASLTTLDIDHDTLDTPEDMPLLPDFDKLYSKLADVLVQHNVDSPELHQRNTSFIDDKKPSIIDAIRLVKSLSESPRQSPKPAGIIPLSSSQNIVVENPIVKELQSIMLRSGHHGEKETTPTNSLSPPTTDIMEATSISDSETDRYCNEESEFSDAVRNVFCNYFVERFANYENFVIIPNQSYAQWTKNREQFQNFDKTAFLSDQPLNSKKFYSAFLETVMFTSFVDDKLISLWDSKNSSKELILFDKFVENYRLNSGIITTPSTGTTPLYESTDFRTAIATTPKPHLFNRQDDGTAAHAVEHENGTFPVLDSTLLTQCEEEQTDSYTRIENESPLPPKALKEMKLSDTLSTTSKGTTAYHSKFVLQLWRESRLRVKHMLGSSPEAQSNIEENTHIANLCDLLERIWGHGLKRRESKSSLWAHLMAFSEQLVREEAPPAEEPARSFTPDPYSHFSLRTSEHQRNIIAHASLDASPIPRRTSTPSLFRRRFQSPELKSLVEAILQPPPSSYLDDLQIVSNMKEIKTDVGHTRAWVRLCLEKKSLSRHLSSLLSNTGLCRQRYRNYAFLLTEDEKEQFLLHLLSLSAGDFNCFTSAFPTTNMSYRVLVVGEGKYFGLSTSCLYVNVGGENGESGTIPIPRGSYQVEFTCRNLGFLTCVRLNHDNSGLVRSLLVEMVLVYCITTGQTYRFHCGRYFARAEDDGGIDRFIVGEKVSRKLKGSVNMIALGVDDLLPSTGVLRWNRSPKKDTGEKPTLSQVKAFVTNSVAKLIAVCQDSSKEALRGKLLAVLYGSNGFVKAMESALQFGFKNTRKFQKPLFLWDLIERAVPSTTPQLRVDDRGDMDDSVVSVVSSLVVNTREVDQTFINVVSSVNKFTTIGKDEKMMLFFLLGLRDHRLPSWVQVLASSPSIQTVYEPLSFLRDPELLSFYIECLMLTHSLSVVLEPLLVQGL